MTFSKCIIPRLLAASSCCFDKGIWADAGFVALVIKYASRTNYVKNITHTE